MAQFEIVFTPTFEHEDWVDNVDRVQAAGDNGFNIRFRGLRADLDRLSAVVGELNGALNELGQAPTPQELMVTVAPTLIPTAAEGWGHRIGFAEKPAGQTSAAGMASVQLPHGARIRGLRVTGRNNGGGNLRISLQRQPIAVDAPAQRIVQVNGAGDPFDSPGQADPQVDLVDNSAHRYFILAQLNNAGPADIVMLAAFQVSVMAA
jgi:hypothetical protein